MSRPLLAPGLRVLRRSRTELQVGLVAEHRVVVPDTEPVRRTLDQLTRGEVVGHDPTSRAVLDALDAVLVDGDGLVRPGVAPGDVAAVALADPRGFRRRLDDRRTAAVSVRGTLGDGLDPRPLLSAAGVRVCDHPRPSHVLVLSLGEIDRTTLDPLVRDGVPHLLVRLVEGTATIGPFVDPGLTACLRCLDAHQAVADPRGGVLAMRHALARNDRRDGVAEPVDSALAALALAWAVRDLVTHVEGERPSSWSSTVSLAPMLASVTQTEWLRHPACGCGWLRDERSSRTMDG